MYMDWADIKKLKYSAPSMEGWVIWSSPIGGIVYLGPDEKDWLEVLMPFPKTRDEMVKSGYIFERHTVCRGLTCKREIELWKTPGGKFIPMDLMQAGSSEAVTHFATCPDREAFKK